MANQIAREFEGSQPGNAALATWDHLWHFWNPRMTRAIVAHLDAGGAGLSANAAAAVARLRDGGEPVAQTPATQFGVTTGGETQSDAG